jgi:hypothetical protein
MILVLIVKREMNINIGGESLEIPKKYEIPSANLLKMHHQLTSEPIFLTCLD